MDQDRLDKMIRDTQRNLEWLSTLCEELSKKPPEQKNALEDLCRLNEFLSRMTRLRIDIFYNRTADIDSFAKEAQSIASKIRNIAVRLRGVFPDVDFEPLIIILDNSSK